jgi:hypothetical protein
MALGFVASCTIAKIVMSRTVENTSSDHADGRAGAGLQAGGGLENSENSESTYFNESPAVVAVKLVVCLLEKRPNEDHCKLGFTCIHGPDSVELRDTISWVSNGGLRKKMAQALAGLVERRMPPTGKPTLVFPRSLSLDEATYDVASDAARDDIDTIVDGPGNYRHAVFFWKIVRQA